MRSFARYLLQGAILVILLTLVTVAARWLLVLGEAMPGSIVSPEATVPLPAPSPTQPPVATATTAPTPLPSSTPTPIPTPSPTPIPPTPTAVAAIELPESAINVLLLGADQETLNGNRWRTDVIVVASFNPEGPSVSMLSIPRDLLVWVPDSGFRRINAVEYQGEVNGNPGEGTALLKATIEHNLGIPIHYFARVDFAGFIRIVDTLGGVDVPVECELHDTFPNPTNPEEGIDIDLMPGVQHLDGRQALWYVRSRWSTHDFDRNRRQQQVLRAIYRQALNLDVIPRIPDLWGAVQETVRTDLTLEEMIRLGLAGSQLDWANVKSRFVAPPYVAPSVGPDDAYALLPVPGALEALVAESLLPAAAGRADQPPFRVEVLDGTGKPGMAAVAVERLLWEGFEVVATSPADGVYPRTHILDLTTTSKGSPLWLLMRLYARDEGDVIRQPTEGSVVDFRVVLGADYDPCVPTGTIWHVPTPTPAPTSVP